MSDEHDREFEAAWREAYGTPAEWLRELHGRLADVEAELYPPLDPHGRTDRDLERAGLRRRRSRS